MSKKRNRQKRNDKNWKKGQVPKYILKQQYEESLYENPSAGEPKYYPPTNFKLFPKNDRQKDLIDAITNYPITFGIGAFGTGKTFVAAGTIAKLWTSYNFEKIILARSNVPTGPTLGFFPGEPEEKLAHWLALCCLYLNRLLEQLK